MLAAGFLVRGEGRREAGRAGMVRGGKREIPPPRPEGRGVYCGRSKVFARGVLATSFHPPASFGPRNGFLGKQKVIAAKSPLSFLSPFFHPRRSRDSRVR